MRKGFEFITHAFVVGAVAIACVGTAHAQHRHGRLQQRPYDGFDRRPALSPGTVGAASLNILADSAAAALEAEYADEAGLAFFCPPPFAGYYGR